MMLYTTMPIEAVLEGYDSFKPEYRELDYPGGGKLILEQLSPTEGRLVRLISSNPGDYLRPECQPGSIVNFTPTTKKSNPYS